MKQFKALIRKEWITHRNPLLAPVWVTLSVYGVFLIGIVIALIKQGTVAFYSGGMPPLEQGQLDLIAWYSVAGAVSLLGFVTILTGMGICDGMLNGDRRKRCEIFHLSQPVSLLKALGAKYAALFSGSMAILLILVLVNSVLLSAGMAWLMGAGFWIGLTGGMISFVGVIFSYLFAISLMWLFSSVFKHKPLLLAALIISGIEVSIHLLNYLVGWSIPSLWQYLLRMLNFTVKVGSVGKTQVQSALIVSDGAKGLLSLDNLLRLVYSAVCFWVGYFVYKRREVV